MDYQRYICWQDLAIYNAIPILYPRRDSKNRLKPTSKQETILDKEEL